MDTARPFREVFALIATALAHLLTWQWPVVHAVVVIIIMGGWTAWIVRRCRRDADTRARLGLKRGGFAHTLKLVAPLATVTAGLMAAYAWSQGRLDIPWTTAVLFLVYPAWGLVQQLLVQGVFVQQMRAQPNLGRRPWLVALIAGAFFGVVHWPFPMLMVATALMGTVFAFIYMRYQNLWPLGIAHGWLGALFFLWVMDKDPMALTLAAAQLM